MLAVPMCTCGAALLLFEILFIETSLPIYPATHSGLFLELLVNLVTDWHFSYQKTVPETSWTVGNVNFPAFAQKG